MRREKSGRAGRRLSRSEHELWVSVTRAIPPLRPRPLLSAPEELPSPPPVAAPAPLAPDAQKSPTKPAPPLTGLDRRLRQRLVRGRAEIDGRLDLHGFTQAEAHDALLGFLRTRRNEGGRVVLVITGKGLRGAESERGVLRRQVPLWLRSPQLREVVLGFEPAGPAHGGEGAFYVRLRRVRS